MLKLYNKEGKEITNECTEFCSNPSCLGEPWCSGWEICKEQNEGNNKAMEKEKEQYYDRLFLECCQQEKETDIFVPPLCTTTSNPRFAPPKTDKEIEEARKASMAKKTREDMKYCVRVWEEWKKCRNISKKTKAMTETELNDNLSHFVLEIRKTDGNEYPPDTVYHICCGIMRYLHLECQPGIDFFKNASVKPFRDVLDSEMKRLRSQGLGAKKRQAEPISQEEEELLEQHSAQALVDTMLYMSGTYFALRYGQEHRALHHSPSQIELVEKPCQRAFLKYTEELSKNNQGGIKGRKRKPKVVIHHENIEYTSM